MPLINRMTASYDNDINHIDSILSYPGPHVGIQDGGILYLDSRMV